MESMVERVADALEPMCFGQGQTRRNVAIELARTAIRAMREPTKEMVAQGYSEITSRIERDGQDLFEAWRAMIDEALRKQDDMIPIYGSKVKD